MANSVDPEQTAPKGAVCSGSMLFASILNSSVTQGNYLQQTTSAVDIFRCIFSCLCKGYFCACWVILRVFCGLLFFAIFFFKKYFRNTIKVSNCFHPGQKCS